MTDEPIQPALTAEQRTELRSLATLRGPIYDQQTIETIKRLARLALDGFGFTQKDVDQLRSDAFYPLADRIAALLPPSP